MRVLRLSRIPPITEIPEILVDSADSLALPREDCEQIRDKGCVPQPLTYVLTPRSQLEVVEGCLDGPQLAENTLKISIHRKAKECRVVSDDEGTQQLLLLARIFLQWSK